MAGGVLLVALVAGAVRVLPLLLAPGVPLRLVPVLGRGVVAIALEVALFVAPPLGWALATARLVERGEARALHALGVSPLGVVARGWPALLGAALAAALAAGAWGREARAPGRGLRALVLEAREACAAAPPPAAAEVPIVGLSWVCLAGDPPRAVAPLPSGGAFAAAAVEVSDDLSAVQATGLDLLLPGPPEARLHAGSATLRGLPPLVPAGNLGAAARALVLAATTAALAVAAALAILHRPAGRVGAALVGAAGPAAALLVFSALEGGGAPLPAYFAVPIAGLAAILAVTTAAALTRRRGRPR